MRFNFEKASNDILRTILGEAMIKSAGLEASETTLNIARNILAGLDITVDRIREQVGTEAVVSSNVVLKSLVNGVDEATASLSRSMGSNPKYINMSQEDVDNSYSGVFCESEDKNIMAQSVVDILDNVVSSLTTDIKTASKLVLQSIKEDQDAKKEIEENNLEDFDNPEGGEPDELSGDEEEPEKENKEENPFEGKKDEEEKDEKEEEDKEAKSNVEDEENPFESIKNGKIDINLYGWNAGSTCRPFAGLEAEDIAKFSQYCATKHMGEGLVESYNNMTGMEDEAFKKNVDLFRNVGRTYGTLAVSGLLLLGKLGLQGNNNAIKYPHLYTEEE